MNYLKKGFLALSLISAAVLLSGCGLKKSPAASSVPQAEPTSTPARSIAETISKRPFVSLTPTTDGHWVNLEIKNLIKGTTGINYDLVYLADFEGSKIERGVSTGGVPIDLNGADEYQKKILFGSASCTTGTCKYKYDENVTEGSLNLNLVGGLGEKYEVSYRIQRGSEGKQGLTTGDGLFSFVSSALSAKSLYLTISTIGIPTALPAGVVPKSEPYGLFPAITAKGIVSFKTDLTSAVIYASDGKSWRKLETKIANGVASAEASGVSYFILAE